MIPYQETKMVTCQKCVMHTEQRVVNEPYTVCKMVPEERCHTVRKAVCRMEYEERCCQVPHTTCKMVAEECVRQVPHTTCKMEAVCGTQTCQRVEKFLMPIEPCQEPMAMPCHKGMLHDCRKWWRN
jgi:hypothetical protein